MDISATARCLIIAACAAVTEATAQEPSLLSALADASGSRVRLSFSQALEELSATNCANYTIEGGLAVNRAALQPDGSNVVLQTSQMEPGARYTVRVADVRNLSGIGVAPDTMAAFRSWVIEKGWITREVFYDIPGVAVSNLTSAQKFLDGTPDVVERILCTETPSHVADYYGQRLYGYILPPASDEYVFYVASDNQSELWISSDHSPNNKHVVASVEGWTQRREWHKYPSQKSAPIAMQSGKAYYFEVLMKEDGSGDVLAVGWATLARSNSIEVLSRTRIGGLVDQESALPWIEEQPRTCFAAVGGDASLTVTADGATPVAYRWFRDGVAVTNGGRIFGVDSNSCRITGVLPSDAGLYSVCVTNPIGMIASAVVPLRTYTGSSSPTQLVEGVSQVVALSLPGAVAAYTDGWWSVVSGDQHANSEFPLVMAREYGNGRIVMTGGVFPPGLLDNGRFVLNVFQWLGGTTQGSVLCSTGHQEARWLTEASEYGSMLQSNGWTAAVAISPLDLSQISTASVLFVGNAFGEFTVSEVEAVRAFVEQGGGLYCEGLGPWWVQGAPLAQYPMNHLLAPYGGRWLAAHVEQDVDHRYLLSPYANASVYDRIAAPSAFTGIDEAMGHVRALHGVYQGHLTAALDRSHEMAAETLSAHVAISSVLTECEPGSRDREQVFGFYTQMASRYPQFYGRVASLPPDPAVIRERAWRTWRDCLTLTYDRKVTMATTGRLWGRYRDLFLQFGTLLLDNVGFTLKQTDFIYRYLSLLPPAFQGVEAISCVVPMGEWTVRWPELNAGYIFGNDVGAETAGAWPSEIPFYTVDSFSSVAAHELNHWVDAWHIGSSTVLLAREQQLISQAGNDHMNYLSSVPPDGFFTTYPQEFFASISGMWFSDSQRCMALAFRRFEGGRSEPINQALHFAEVYALGGRTVPFYLLDTSGNLYRRDVPVTRDADNHIDSMRVGPCRYRFVRDASGNVSSATLESEEPAGVTVWPLRIDLMPGACGTFAVQLNTPPTGVVTVEVARIDGITGVQVLGPKVLTFDASDWYVLQTVAVTNSGDEAELGCNAIIGITCGGLPSANVSVWSRDSEPRSLIAGMAVGASGTLSLSLLGDPGMGYVMEASSNLFDWVSVDTNTLAPDETEWRLQVHTDRIGYYRSRNNR